MAHWSERHTKKDIVEHYEAEIARLTAEVERLRTIADGKWKCIERAENDHIWNDAIDAAAGLASKSVSDGGVAKSPAFFATYDEHQSYKDACLLYRAAIRSLHRTT